MLRLCRVDCKCCFRPRSLPTANLQLEPSSHRGGKWYRRLISSTAWPSAQLNSGLEPRKNSCYAHFTWCEHSKKTSAGGDREQLVLLLFICSKSGKSKLTRRMVILRFEMQNLKEQFTPNSRLHVFPHPVFLDCVGVCSPLFVILFFLIMKCTVVLEAPENTPENLFAEVTPCFSWSPQTLLWAVSCGNYFLSTKLQPSNSLLGQTSTYPCWDLIPVTGCKHWRVLLSRAVMLAVCVLLWAGRAMVTVPMWSCSFHGSWRVFYNEPVMMSGKTHHCWAIQRYCLALRAPRGEFTSLQLISRKK